MIAMGVFHFGKNMVIYADYVIDYEYISEVLCINKDKPKSKCNGKCHLAKQLKQSNPEPVEEQPALLTEVEFLFYFFGETNPENQALENNRDKNYGELVNLFKSETIEVLDPPPISLV